MSSNEMSLGGSWQIRSTDGEYTLEGPVPGTVFGVLDADSGNPEGLFFRENNRQARWTASRDFVFSRTFDWDGEPDGYLECDGLDTLATITVNGRLVGETRNTHRRYRFSLKEVLREGTNNIEILFADSLAYVEKEFRRRKIYHSYQDSINSVNGYNMIRKSHCSYGWDWGPVVPDVGIWRDIRIVRKPWNRVGDVRVLQDHENAPDSVVLKISGRVAEIPAGSTSEDAPAVDGLRMVYRILDPQERPAGEVTAELGESVNLTIDTPELWWPAGMGAQPLYTLVSTLEAGGEELDSRKIRLGLRTLDVQREPDAWGESFTVTANGVPLFARGANFIPEDVVLTRVSPERTRGLLDDAVAANYNCLRIWGGGVYPSDLFYDACDERGLLVWQDMMFACATYDVRNPDFRQEIHHEVTDNIRRLRHHAALAIICGNNEMEWGFECWPDVNPTQEMREEYLRQYEEIISGIAAEEAPQTFYWPASPSSGGAFDEPNDPNRGDTHFWDVWHENKDFAEYSRHDFRFMSEFGFESFPALSTIDSFTEPGDRNIFSPVMEDHQRCEGGNGKILTYLSKYFRYPESLDHLVYLSQLSQSEALRHGIEHWRRKRGKCMGSIYWQFNDNWPVASWSSIDYYGRWKAAHYLARRAYHPVLVSAEERDGTVGLHLSNEAPSPVRGTLTWRLLDATGTELASGEVSAEIPAFSSREVTEVTSTPTIQESALPEVNKIRRNRILAFSFTTEAGEVFRGSHVFVRYKFLNLQEPHLSFSVVGESQSQVDIRLDASAPALFVELGFGNVDRTPSDNFFHLMPGDPVFVGIPKTAEGLLAAQGLGGEELTGRKVEEILSLRSLFDIRK